jgi:GH15 family glucan-1,4-alpha-glucosidase
MQEFPPISDYGFLSDCRSAALVASDGSVDWLCWPRFDSPSLFARLLDRERGGCFQIAPTERYRVERSYIERTNVLRTSFITETGRAELEDWLHVGSRQALCRLVRCTEGEIELASFCDPRPEYGADPEPLVFQPAFGYLSAQIDAESSLILNGFNEAWGDQPVICPSETFTLKAGEQHGFSLGFNRPGPSDLASAQRRALAFWWDWSRELTIPETIAPEQVIRSALVLKGLQYAPSGAIIAAPTTSLPEQIGGERNFDYRYSWLRDASFTLYALRSVGQTGEAESYFDWLKAIVLRYPSAPLRIMYAVDGSTELSERELGHLEGYRGSRPVRVGNGAATQNQLDTLGELADAIALFHRRRSDSAPNPQRWLLVRDLAERAAVAWHEPDQGIWEIRGPSQHFVYSKVMCWVALDRAIRLSARAPAELVDAGQIESWRREQEKIRDEVLERGYDAELGSFVQAYDSKALDASNLLLARVGFVAPSDPRFVGTVRATQRLLAGRGGLVERYDPEQTDDGFSGREATFAVCSLWLVLALLEIGSPGEARILFERVLACASPLGLFAEELTAEGAQLGNFPQAFTHIALIVAAFALDRAEARQRRAGPSGERREG